MYKPQIIYDSEQRPFLYCNISNIEEGIQPELLGAVEKLLQGYVVGTERTQAWLRKAEQVNAEWRARKDLSDRTAGLFNYADLTK